MNAFRQLLHPLTHRVSEVHRVPHQRVPLGTWVMSASPMVAEAVGCAGFDWVVVDMEHSPLDLAGVVSLLQALGSTKSVPIVRVPSNDPVAFKRVLDAGATTVMVPFVQDADEARRAVASTRYPPAGVRGVSGMSRATRYGTHPERLREADAGIALIVQIDTAHALARLEEIAEVDGVDALFVGPADLAATMGHLGDVTNPAVRAALGDAAARARAIGKPIGILAASPEMAAQARAAGFDFVGLGSDLGLLINAAQKALAALQGTDPSLVHSLAAGTHAY